MPTQVHLRNAPPFQGNAQVGTRGLARWQGMKKHDQYPADPTQPTDQAPQVGLGPLGC